MNFFSPTLSLKKWAPSSSLTGLLFATVTLACLSGAIVMQMCVTADAHDQGKPQNTWHEILKSRWFIYPITPPHLPTSNTNDIKNVERFDMQMPCTGDKTFCLPPFHHIRLWQRCCLISFLAQKAPLNSSQRWLWLTSFSDPPTHTKLLTIVYYCLFSGLSVHVGVSWFHLFCAASVTKSFGPFGVFQTKMWSCKFNHHSHYHCSRHMAVIYSQRWCRFLDLMGQLEAIYIFEISDCITKQSN